MNTSKHEKRKRDTGHDTGNRKPRRGLGPIVVLALLLAVAAPPALAGTTAALVPAVGDVPDGIVLDDIPEFLGPLYRVDETSVPGLVVLVTVPIARDRENWDAIVNTCATDEEDVAPDMDACADAHPELLDNRDWTYFTLWRVGLDQRLSLLAIARQGRFAGETTASRIFLSELAGAGDDLTAWQGSLLAQVSLGDLDVLDAMYDEVIEYTALAEDDGVLEAWYRARTRLLQQPCWSITKDYPRCSDCCDDRRDGCEGECDRFGIRAYATGCVGAAVGCAVTGAGAPAAGNCCMVVGGFLGWLAKHYCYINCRGGWHDCKDGCDSHFP